MANQEQLAILKRGVEAWNTWKDDHPYEVADLRRADLSQTDLSQANLTWVNLRRADLSHANLCGANLTRASLSGANLTKANLSWANLSGAHLVLTNLVGADLGVANLSQADLRMADLNHADLRRAALIETRLQKANLTGCRIHGVSVWDIALDNGTRQSDLIITPSNQPTITVDNLEVAQFIYLLLNNQRIRHIIDTITSKVVLILGRFTPERKAVLDAIRQWLREHDYLPILFDFDLPGERDVTETVTLLARMARFIIADLTAPSSIPKELEAIIPTLAVPVQPLLEGSTTPFSMFRDYRWKYDWVLKPYRYASVDNLLASLNEAVVTPAEKKAAKLRRRRLAALAE